MMICGLKVWRREILTRAIKSWSATPSASLKWRARCRRRMKWASRRRWVKLTIYYPTSWGNMRWACGKRVKHRSKASPISVTGSLSSLTACTIMHQTSLYFHKIVVLCLTTTMAKMCWINLKSSWILMLKIIFLGVGLFVSYDTMKFFIKLKFS